MNNVLARESPHKEDVAVQVKEMAWKTLKKFLDKFTS